MALLLLLMSTLLRALPVEDEQNESSEPKHAVVATTVSGPFRKRHPVKRFVILLGIVLMTSLIVGCISLYKHLANASKVVGPGETYQYIARCGVDDDGFTDPLDADAAMNGEFELQVEINDEFEKILVPAIGDTRNATILHDFNVNMTAIIDEEKGFCYIINLNRSLALPPHDFRDLLIKLKVEYYIPDSEVFHENYHAVTPPIQDLTPFGIHIKEECSKLNLYRLVKIGEPVAAYNLLRLSKYEKRQYFLKICTIEELPATVYGACVVNEGSAPCPPPFPDFAAIFRETLNLIPELRLSIQNTTSAEDGGACSPMAVNWSEFNSRLSDGNPVPPGPVCQQSSTTAPSYGGSSTTSPGQFVSPEVIPGGVQSAEARDRIIAIAVGVGGGVVVIAAAVIIFVVIKCRGRRKSEGLLRTTSTISQAALVTDESYQPTTPDTPFAQNAYGPFDNSHSLRKKGVIELSDCTYQESSTDVTLPRATHVTPERGGGVTTEKEIESLEEAKKSAVGCCVNLAAATEDEDQDDAGYAGSEIGQELWENEMNALFEGAKMEENEDEEAVERGAQPAVKNRRQEEKSDPGSVGCDDTAPQIRDSPISTKLELNLNSSTSEPSAYQSIELTPAKLPGSPFSTPSSAKPLISPRHFGSRHPLSQAPASDQDSPKVAAKAKVRFEVDSNETPPPAYSSPPPLALAGAAGGLFNGDRHTEMPIDVPNELPSYTEAVSALGDHESNGWRPVAAKRKQPKPQPMPKRASSVDSQSKSPETISSPWGRSTDAAAAVVPRPRVPPPTAKKIGADAAAAAVVPRPRVPPPTAKKIGVDDESARQDRVDSNVEGDDDTSTGHSSRPVRSLLSQFEAIANRKPD